MDNTIRPHLLFKQCPQCENWYPPTSDYFHKVKSTGDDLRAICRQCQKEMDARRYQASKHFAYEVPSELYCPRCEQTKSSSQFHKNATGRYGLATHCKKCANKLAHEGKQTPEAKARDHATQKAYYHANKAMCRAKWMIWYRENREDVLAKARQFTKEHPEIRSAQWHRWARKDEAMVKQRLRVRNRRARRKSAEGNYTSTDIEALYTQQEGKCFYCHKDIAVREFHIDHYIPLSRGGTNWPSNLRIACPLCNLRKGTLLPDEFRAI